MPDDNKLLAAIEEVIQDWRGEEQMPYNYAYNAETAMRHALERIEEIVREALAKTGETH